MKSENWLLLAAMSVWTVAGVLAEIPAGNNDASSRYSDLTSDGPGGESAENRELFGGRRYNQGNTGKFRALGQTRRRPRPTSGGSNESNSSRSGGNGEGFGGGRASAYSASSGARGSGDYESSSGGSGGAGGGFEAYSSGIKTSPNEMYAPEAREQTIAPNHAPQQPTVYEAQAASANGGTITTSSNVATPVAEATFVTATAAVPTLAIATTTNTRQRKHRHGHGHGQNDQVVAVAPVALPITQQVATMAATPVVVQQQQPVVTAAVAPTAVRTVMAQPMTTTTQYAAPTAVTSYSVPTASTVVAQPMTTATTIEEPAIVVEQQETVSGYSAQPSIIIINNNNNLGGAAEAGEAAQQTEENSTVVEFDTVAKVLSVPKTTATTVVTPTADVVTSYAAAPVAETVPATVLSVNGPASQSAQPSSEFQLQQGVVLSGDSQPQQFYSATLPQAVSTATTGSRVYATPQRVELTTLGGVLF